MSKVKFAKLQQIADEVGGTVRTNYSGRFMFGRTCVGIVLNPWAMDSLSDAIRDAGANRILTKSGRSQDSMGLDTIIYWTQVTCTDAPDVHDDLA